MLDNLNKIITGDIAQIISDKNIDWNRLSGKTVFITGANGFLPAYMVLPLLALNDELNLGIKILALVRNEFKAEARFKDLLKREDIKLIVQDVSKPITIEEDIHFVLHVASRANPEFYGSDPVGITNANVLVTSYLLELAAQKKVEKFLLSGSSEIYGLVDRNKIPISEKDYAYIDPTIVRSCYSEGKKLEEALCVSWMHQHQVPVSIIRIFHTYGPGMDLYDGRVFANFVCDIVNNRDIIMKSNGSSIRAYCYLADAVMAYFTILLNGEAYNIGNPDFEYSVLELTRCLVKPFPEKNLKVRISTQDSKYMQSKVSRISPNIDKVKKLGWYPKTSIEEGFIKTIKSYTMLTN